MKVIVYTCITGDYDSVIEIDKKEKDVKYICFTNNKNIKSNTWEVKYIDEDIDDWTLARKVKILSHKYLPEHEVSIWMDAAIRLLKPVSTFIEKKCNLNEYDMVCFKHQERDCIYDEIKANIFYRREQIDVCKKIEKFLLSEKYPKNNGLIETTVLVRKNTSKVHKLMNDWFDMVTNYSRRDQLSLNYVIWKNNFNVQLLDMYVFDNQYFKHFGHTKVKTIDYRVCYDELGACDWHDICDDKSIIDLDKNVQIKLKVKKDTSIINVMLFNVGGNRISDVKTNNKKTDIEFENVITNELGSFLLSNSIIKLKGNYNKGDILVLNFKLYYISYDDYVESLSFFVNQTNELKVENEKMKNEIKELNDKNNILVDTNEKIKNSRTYRFADKLRRIKNKLSLKK